MDKRKKCGTCRFFRDADIAGSGWCTHPQRGQYHDLVLVRKEELACRNSWDQDLWEPSGDQSRQRAPRPAPHAQPIQDIGIDRPVMPGAEAPAIPMDGATDRVTEISVPLERARPPMPTTRPWTAGPASQPDSDLPGISALATADEAQHGAEIDDRRSEDHHTKHDQTPTEDDEARTAAGYWSATNPYEARSTKNVPMPPTPTAAREHTSRMSHDPHRIAMRNRPSGEAKVPNESISKPLMGTRGGQGTEPLPIEELNKAIEGQAPARHPESSLQPGISLPAEDASIPGFYARQEQTTTPAQRDDAAPHVHVDGVDLGSGRNSEFRRNPRPAPDSSPDPIDTVTWISGIPRCCATCKDFRRESDGKTGVCTNSYAFQEQPVVQSDQLACQSSGYTWWLPHDEVWLERADTSHHTRPTPYLDAALAIRQVSEHGRESRDS